MKRLITLLMTLVVSLAQAQKPSIFTKEDILPLTIKCTSAFGSGMMKGVHEKILRDYPAFQDKLPNANPSYCNPSLSWVNKYKNHDPLQGYDNVWSRYIGVAYKDLYHLSNTIDVGLFTFGCIFPLKSDKFRFRDYPWRWLLRYGGEGSLIWLSRNMGFTLTYDVFFKSK